MNYLLLTEYFPSSEKAEITGGVENRCFYFVKELSKKHKITVLCSRQKGQKKISRIFEAKVIRCGPINPYSHRSNILRRLAFAFSLYFVGKKLKDINIVEGASFITYLPAYFLGRKLKAKKIATWHETWVKEWIKNKGFLTGIFGELWERIALKLKWDQIISVSHFTKKRLLKRKVKCKRIRVVPNGIDLKEIKKIRVKKERFPTLCVLGRLTKQKRVDLVIKALKPIEKEIPQIKLKIIGQGPEFKNLKKLVKNLNLEKNVEFLGFLSKHNDVLKILKASHLYVSASQLEGFGITVLEAMACEVPCLLSKIEPFKEITQNQAFFFRNQHDLSQKILLLLKNRETYLSQVKKQNKIIKKYDWGLIFRNG